MTFSLPGGASATLVDSDGHHVSLRCSVASPPGSTLRATALAETTESVSAESASAERHYQVKVRGCTKEAEGAFLVTGRFVSLSRAQRALVLGAG